MAATIFGEVCSAHTLIAPADWPTIVTLSGLPPNAAAFLRTHSSALMLSSIVKLPEFVFASPVLSCGRLKKLTAKQDGAVPNELAKWNKASGKVFEGLVRRREAEGLLFSHGTYRPQV